MTTYARFFAVLSSLACGALTYPYFRASLQLHEVNHPHALAGLGAVAATSAVCILLWSGLQKISQSVLWIVLAAVALGILLRDPATPGGIGASLGIGIAQAFVIGLFLVALAYKGVVRIRAVGIGGMISPSTLWAGIAVWAIVVASFGLWFSLSRFVWFWDYAEYAHLISNLADAARTLGLGEVFGLLRSTLDAEYNLVPAFFPSLVEYAIGSSDRSVLIFSIALVYVGPAILFMAYLVHRACGRKLSGAMALVLVLLATILYPLTFFAALYGMPDIGGVILIIAVASTFYRDKSEKQTGNDRLSTLILCAGIIFLLCVFRRWYLFVVPFLIFALATREWHFWRKNGKGEYQNWFWRAAFVFASFLTLCTLAFYWQRMAVMAKGDYVDAYRAWWPGLRAVALTAVWNVGYLPWGIAVLSIIVLATNKKTRTTALGAVLCLMTTLFLFMRVQALAPHHYLLVLPVLIFMVAYSVGMLYLDKPRVGKVAIFFLAIFSITSAVGVTHPDSRGKLISAGIFPKTNMLPPRRNDLPELYRLDRYLGTASRDGKTFCIVATGAKFNASTVMESAIDSGEARRTPILSKQLWLGDVDRRDGPATAFPSCDMAVVGDRIDAPLGEKEQQVIVYLAEALHAGKGIGASFQPTSEQYDLDDGLRVRVYRKVSPILPGDWQRYVDAVSNK